MRLSMICLALAAMPVAANAFIAENRHHVNPLPGGAFEVIGEPGSGGAAYWCAAGDYATRVLGAGGTQRIYISRGRGRPETSNRRSAVQFSMTPPAGADTSRSLTLQVDRAGDNLGVAFARRYCDDFRMLDF